jgi:hypothetical protein
MSSTEEAGYPTATGRGSNTVIDPRKTSGSPAVNSARGLSDEPLHHRDERLPLVEHRADGEPGPGG